MVGLIGQFLHTGRAESVWMCLIKYALKQTTLIVFLFEAIVYTAKLYLPLGPILPELWTTMVRNSETVRLKLPPQIRM